MTETAPTAERKGLFKEVIMPFSVATGVIILLTHGMGVLPFLKPYVSWLVAGTFIGIPAWSLRKRGENWESIGAIRESWSQYLKPALVLAAVVFPLYAVGYHGVQTMVLDREFEPAELELLIEDSGPLSLLIEGPKAIDKRPEQLGLKPLEIWEERGAIYVLWNLSKGERLDLSFNTDGTWDSTKGLLLKEDGLYHRKQTDSRVVKTDDHSIRVTANQSGGLSLQSIHATSLGITALLNDVAIPKDKVALGEFRLPPASPGPWNFSRSFLWLLPVLLMHIVMVGVPEEIFYRGFIQTRLRSYFPDRWTFLGTSWGPSVILTSILFALGHFLIELDPARLIVFFPSLLFGWMKNRVGTIGSVAVFHGLCNVLLNVMQRFYLG